MELFQWRSSKAGQERLLNLASKAEVEEELADILISCLAFANQADLDISGLITGKLEKNESRFPPGVPILVVSKRLGHTKVSTTLDIYGHFLPGMQDHAAAMMDELVTLVAADLQQIKKPAMKASSFTTTGGGTLDD